MAFFSERFFIDHHNLRHFNSVTRDPNNVDIEWLRKDTDRAKANMDKAAQYGMNGYVLFSQSFEEVLNYDFPIPGFSGKIYSDNHPHRSAGKIVGEYLREASEYGKSLGIKVYFHCNQFAMTPEAFEALNPIIAGTARVCPGKDVVWEIFRNKITEFFTLFPAMAGLQLTTSETQVSATSCNCPDCQHLSAEDRFARMAREAWAACSAMGKGLQFRTWGEIMEWDEKYLRMISLLPEKVVISTKNTLTDFHLSDPPSRLIGVGDRAQIIEFDCWGEYYGWNQFPCYMGDQFSERFRICADKGIQQVAGRVNWEPRANFLFDHPYGNEVNMFTFAKLTQDPYRDPDDILGEWLSERVPESVISKAMEFYKLTYQAQYTWLNFNNFNCNDHSRVYQLQGRPDFRHRLDFQVGELAQEGFRFEPTVIAQQRKEIAQRFDECGKAMQILKGHIPDVEYTYMESSLTNQCYCSQGIADCLEMYGYMLARDRGEKLPDLSSLESEIKRKASEWCAFDEDNFKLMMGPNVTAVFEELTKVDV